MTQLAIIGHKTRGKEIIELLEMFGYVNYHKYSADCDSLCFYGGENTSTIYYDWVNNCEDMRIFTLEEFLEKFPYKVGDKVQHKGAISCGSVFEVEKMRWVDEHVEYTVKRLWYHNGYSVVTAKVLQPFEEETMDKAVFDANAQCCDIMNHLIKKKTMEGKIESFEVLESHCANEVKIEFDPSKFEIVKRDNGYYVVKKQPQYPKTYDECCTIMGFNSNTLMWNNFFSINKDTHPYIKHFDNLIDNFCKLLICRDAYWKIAGEEMGLGKPWKPDWLDISTYKYCIYYVGDEIKKQPMSEVHHFLAFPTAKVRDAFYENFKELIEKCKELL